MSSSLNSRFRNMSFGSRRRSSNNVSGQTTLSSPTTNGNPRASPPHPTVSTNSAPMNPNNRPPAYPNSPPQYGHLGAPQPGGRSVSPLPPVNTATGHGYPPPQVYGPPAGGPPPYPPQPQAGPYGYPTPAAPPQTYPPSRGSAVEIEGAGRSKAQLIVGIDFVRHFAHKRLGTL